MPWSLAAAAVAAGGSIYAANKSSSAAKDAAQSTKVNPYSGLTPFGATGFDQSTGQFSAAPAPNPFSNVLGSLGLASLANAGTANSSPFHGASPELVSAFNSASDSSAPGSAEFMDVLNKLRAVSAPQEQRDRVSLDTNQFNTGTLGTTGGAERFRALHEAQNQADLQRQLAAQGIATTNANQRFANALTTVNNGMSNQQQQFNIGTAANAGQLNQFQQLLQQLGIGVSAGGGVAPNAAMFAAQQSGNVPLAISQIANSPAFASTLQNMFSRSGTAQPMTQTAWDGGYANMPEAPAGYQLPWDGG